MEDGRCFRAAACSCQVRPSVMRISSRLAGNEQPTQPRRRLLLPPGNPAARGQCAGFEHLGERLGRRESDDRLTRQAALTSARILQDDGSTLASAFPTTDSRDDDRDGSRSWGVSRAGGRAAPLPLPCRDGHLGAGADSLGMRGTGVSAPVRRLPAGIGTLTVSRSARWGSELGASDVLVATTKQDCSDSSIPRSSARSQSRDCSVTPIGATGRRRVT